MLRRGNAKYALLGFVAFAIVVPGCSGCCGTSGGCVPDPVYPSDASVPRFDGGYPYDAPWELFDLGHGHDGSVDAGVDAAPTCFVGIACDAVRGCNGGQQCQAPLMGAPLTFDDVDGGTGMLSEAIYAGGYCTNANLMSMQTREGSPGACHPELASDDPTFAGMDGCLACARCVRLPFQLASPSDPALVQCLERCTPSTTTAGGCRTGYTCDFATHTCGPFGCQSDLDCRIVPEDTTGDGVFDVGSGDRYVVDPESTATCNMTTGRCEHAPTPLARAGDPCTRGATCELDGTCLDELTQHWPGGYCTRTGCDLPGRECPTPDKCQDVGGRWAGGHEAATGDFRCLKACTVGAEDASLALGAGGHGDTCRPGYACFHDGATPPGTAGNGACEPGNYDAVTASNVGAPCVTDTECFSPHGLGACAFGACVVIGCVGFSDPTTLCGTGSDCDLFVDGTSACVRSCTTGADCAAAAVPADFGCIDIDPIHRGCWPGCLVSSDCQPGHACVGATTTTRGLCT